MIQAWIEQSQLENDGSIAFQQGIANLERLLALLVPEETTLLANYPNPFNPETWIPYQLAAPSIVTITIYNTRGAVVRHLYLGHQREGYYTSRSRAAYLTSHFWVLSGMLSPNHNEKRAIFAGIDTMKDITCEGNSLTLFHRYFISTCCKYDASAKHNDSGSGWCGVFL